MQLKTSNEPDTFYISNARITSLVACVAVHLSPYDIPENLEVVCKKFAEGIRARKFETLTDEFYAVPEQDLFAAIREILFAIPEFTAWNVSKNTRLRNADVQSNMFVSTFTTTAPDDDFVDLDAFIMEVNRLLRAHDKDYI